MGDLEAVLEGGASHAFSSAPLATFAPDARLRAMVDAHFDAIWRSLRRLGVPEAGVDDAAQQVFLVAARRLDEIEGGRERPYLLGVALRVASEARRTVRRRREVLTEEEALERQADGAAPTTEDLVDQKKARELLDEVLGEMPEELREVFVLFEVEGVKVVDIAALLEVPIGTVGSRIRRARELFEKKVQRRVASQAKRGGAS